MARALVGLGANLGDSAGAVTAACRALARLPRTRLVARAPLYRTRPVGRMAQPWFVNSAALVSTALSPRRLAAELKRIEKGMGRRKRGRNAPREIDLDLLLHGGAVVDLPGLAVPHPRFHRRAFALVPASRIAGRMRHPVLGMTVDGLSRRVGGRSGVRRMKGGPA